MIIHEVLKNKPHESVWDTYKPGGGRKHRLYLKLKKFKRDVREGQYILCRIEECYDRTLFWYHDMILFWYHDMKQAPKIVERGTVR